MALRAGLGKTCGDVIRIGGALIILQVTADAGGAGQIEVVVDVAVGTLARWNGVPAGKRETRCAVIEVHAQPGIGRVAERAVGGEAAGSVVGIAGRLKIGGMTRVAIRRYGLELAGRAVLMA